MNNLPADLSPEVAAWLQTQIAIHNARTAAVLRDEISKVDDWANSIFAALRDAMGHMLCQVPAIGVDLGRDWMRAACRFDQAINGGNPDQQSDDSDSAGELEARAMLYRFYVRTGRFPGAPRR